jgi:hypothetical protein
MSINPNFFASPSGIGPQTGGFNPTPADAISSSLRQNSSLGLMEYALYNDPRVRALSGLMATGIAGDSEQASRLIHNTAQGQLLKDISALAVSSGLVPGGSPTQLAANVQQMVATQGFTVGGNIGRGSPIFGGGAITDMMSRSVFDSVKNNFYDQVTGLPKRGAHGLNMSQMGEAMGQLTARGAFRGMDIGEININEKGIYEFKQNEQKMEKVNKIFSDYAGMLKDARQIFGDLPISELTQNAERLVGTSLRELGSVTAMRSRMANIQATAAAFGLNPAAVAQNMMQMTDAVQMGLYGKAMQDPRMARDPHLMALTSTAFGRTASNISEAALLRGLAAGHSSTAAANAYAEQGKYMPVIGAAEASRMLSQGMMEVASPRDQRVTGNVLAAQAMISSGAIKDPAVASQVQDLITEMGNTGDIRQQAVLNQQLARLVKSGGGDIDRFKAVYSSTEMMNMMSTEDTARYSQFLKNTYSNRLVMEGTKNLNTAGQDYGLFGQGGKGSAGYANREAFSNLITAVDKKAQDALLASVGAGGEIDEKALDKAYEDMPGLSKAISKEKFKETIRQFAKDPGRAQGNLKDQLTGIMDTARANPRFAANSSKREQILADERAVQTYLSTISLGDSLTPEDFGTELMRGFFGAGKIDNNVILASLKNKDQVSTFNIKGDRTGLQLDEAGVNQLASTLGKDQMASLEKALGVKAGDKAELIKKLNTPEGFKALQGNLGGALMGVNDDGTLSIASAAQVEKETKELEMQSMVTAAQRLLGDDAKVGGDLSTVEGREKYNQDVVKELTKNNAWLWGESTKLGDMASKFKEEGYGGQDFEALRLMSASNPNIRKAILDSANEARAKGGNENMQKYNELMALDRELQAANGGGNKFLGVLELMIGDTAQIKLFGE